MVVVVTHELNMASYFPEARNLNESNGDICSDVAGPSISGSGDLFGFQIDHRSRTFTIFPTTRTTGRHLGIQRDYNYHTVFRACYAIMQKVNYLSSTLILRFINCSQVIFLNNYLPSDSHTKAVIADDVAQPSKRLPIPW